MFLIAFVLFISLIVLYRHFRGRNWDHFPGPKSWSSLPFIGHAYLIGNDPLPNMEKLRQKYGDTFRCDVGFLPTVILSKLEDIQEAFKQEVQHNFNR